MNWSERSLSFRARLTLRWTLTFALLLALVSLVVYVGTATFSRHDLDAQVRSLMEHDLLSGSSVRSNRHIYQDPEYLFHDFGFMPELAQLIALDGQVAHSTPGLAGAAALLTPGDVAGCGEARVAHHDGQRRRPRVPRAWRAGGSRRHPVRPGDGGLGEPGARTPRATRLAAALACGSAGSSRPGCSGSCWLHVPCAQSTT